MGTDLILMSSRAAPLALDWEQLPKKTLWANMNDVEIWTVIFLPLKTPRNVKIGPHKCSFPGLRRN